MCSQTADGGSQRPDFACVTVELGYQAHEIIGITVKRYALHNEVHQIAEVEG